MNLYNIINCWMSIIKLLHKESQVPIQKLILYLIILEYLNHTHEF